MSGLHYQNYTAKAVDCNACELSKQCLKGAIKPNDGRGRQVTRFGPKVNDPPHPSERMREDLRHTSRMTKKIATENHSSTDPIQWAIGNRYFFQPRYVAEWRAHKWRGLDVVARPERRGSRHGVSP